MGANNAGCCAAVVPDAPVLQPTIINPIRLRKRQAAAVVIQCATRLQRAKREARALREHRDEVERAKREAQALLELRTCLARGCRNSIGKNASAPGYCSVHKHLMPVGHASFEEVRQVLEARGIALPRTVQ